VSRGRMAALLGGLIGLLAFGVLLTRDLRLPQTRPPVRIPDVVVQSLDLDRTVEGIRWRISAARVERTGDLARGISMDVRASDARRSLAFRALSGELVEEPFRLRLGGVEGRQEQGDIRVRFSSSIAEYRAADRIWRFPSGIRMSDGKVSLAGDSAWAEEGGRFVLRKEVTARWLAGPRPK